MASRKTRISVLTLASKHVRLKKVLSSGMEHGSADVLVAVP